MQVGCDISAMWPRKRSGSFIDYSSADFPLFSAVIEERTCSLISGSDFNESLLSDDELSLEVYCCGVALPKRLLGFCINR